MKTMKAEDIEMKQHRLVKAQEKEKHWKGRVKEVQTLISKNERYVVALEKKLVRVDMRFEEMIEKLKERRKVALNEIKRQISQLKAGSVELKTTMNGAAGYLAAARDEVKQAKAVLR